MKKFTGQELKLAVESIPFGKGYQKIVNIIDWSDACSSCGYFNRSITDSGQRYRCHCVGSCPDATFNNNIIIRINDELNKM